MYIPLMWQKLTAWWQGGFLSQRMWTGPCSRISAHCPVPSAHMDGGVGPGMKWLAKLEALMQSSGNAF